MKDDTSETEFAIKLQDVLLPIDSHWPVEKYKAIDDAYHANDKKLKQSKKRFSSCFRLKLKQFRKYIAPPKALILQLFMFQLKDFFRTFN